MSRRNYLQEMKKQTFVLAAKYSPVEKLYKC